MISIPRSRRALALALAAVLVLGTGAAYARVDQDEPPPVSTVGVLKVADLGHGQGAGPIDAARRAIGTRLAAMADDPHARTDQGTADLAARFAGSSGDPAVMSAFFSALPADKLLTLKSDLATATYAGPDVLARRTSLLAHLRTGLSVAQAGWDPRTQAAYAGALVDATTDPEVFGPGTPSSYAGALSYLLTDSTYSGAFLSAAAGKIDTFERRTPGKDLDVWNRTGVRDTGWAPYFPDSPAGAAHVDPAAALMSALSRNPKAALDFFSQGAVAGGVSDRQMYWLHDRDWSQEHFDALSRALLAATTAPTVLDPHEAETAHNAARLASQTVNLLGHRTDIEPRELTDGSTVKNLATILSTYMYGADEVGPIGGLDWDKGGAINVPMQYFNGTQLNMPLFDTISVRSFIVLAASSRDGFATLRAGIDAFAYRKYSLALDILAANPTNETARAEFKNAYTSQAELEGLFTRAIGDAAIAEAKRKDAATNAMWVAVGEGVFGAVPLGSFVAGGDLGKSVVSSIIGQGRGATADSAAARWGPATAAVRDTQEKIAGQAQATAEYAVLAALAAHPTLLGEPLPDSARSPDGKLLSPDAMGGLGSADVADVVSRLLSPDVGAGLYFDEMDFELAYKDAFFDFYPK